MLVSKVMTKKCSKVVQVQMVLAFLEAAVNFVMDIPVVYGTFCGKIATLKTI